MAASSFSHSEVAAKLVGGALAHIAGKVQERLSIAPVEVTNLERASVGLKPGGQTLFYPLTRETGVYIDMQGALATVWYTGGDFERGLTALEATLKNSGYPMKQLKDEAAAAPKERTKSYQVELGGGRVAHVVAEYAERGAHNQRFLVRVGAQVRKG